MMNGLKQFKLLNEINKYDKWYYWKCNCGKIIDVMNMKKDQ